MAKWLVLSSHGNGKGMATFLSWELNGNPVNIPSNYISSLIGRGGQNIKDLQNRYNVKINAVPAPEVCPDFQYGHARVSWTIETSDSKPETQWTNKLYHFGHLLNQYNMTRKMYNDLYPYMGYDSELIKEAIEKFF